MKTNINLTVAINQTRIASKLGKISGETQNRIMRRLGHPAMLAMENEIKNVLLAPPSPHWMTMVQMLEQIHCEISPKIEALRRAEINDYETDSEVDSETVSAHTVVPSIDPNLTPEWWKNQELQERNERKAITLQIKLQEKANKLARKAARQLACF